VKIATSDGSSCRDCTKGAGAVGSKAPMSLAKLSGMKLSIVHCTAYRFLCTPIPQHQHEILLITRSHSSAKRNSPIGAEKFADHMLINSWAILR